MTRAVINSRTGIFSILRASSLLKGFSMEELSEMLPLMNTVRESAARGTLVTRIYDKAEYIGVIINGRLREQRSDDGKGLHILGYHSRRGSTFGLEAYFSGPGTSPVELLAETDCSWLRIDIGNVIEDKRYKERLTENIFKTLANSAVHCKLHMDVLLATTTREKVMTFFRAMRDKNQSDVFQIAMTQTQMAEFFGVNRSALSRELNKMEREQIIEILPNRRYHVMRWNTDIPIPSSKMKIDVETEGEIMPR